MKNEPAVDSIISNQQKLIARLIGRLAEAIIVKDAPMVLLRLREFLRFVIEQFRREEQIMAQRRYGLGSVHRDDHERIVATLSGATSNIAAGIMMPSDAIGIQMHCLLLDHLKSHDSDLVRFLGRGHRCAPASRPLRQLYPPTALADHARTMSG